MPKWVVRSKLQPPGRLRFLVPRDGLIARMENLFQARFALVHAPAGYGKSTFLANWRESLAVRGIPTAWLSLDEYDQGLFQFLTYLLEACNEADFAAGRDFPEISEQFSVLAPSEISAAVLTGLGRCEGPHVLILDDFHRAQSKDVDQFLNYLLHSMPDNIHVVISTRELPARLSLADLRVRDELVDITQEDLRFSEAEIRTYLEYWVDAPGSLNWAEELHNRTEGWPVALQIVRKWLAEGVPIDQTLAQLSGHSSDLSDYFLEQVLESLPEATREFLLRTSILERVNGELGDVLCASEGSWQKLQELEQKDIFIQILDPQRNWYRFHRLFTEFLQERLRRNHQSEMSGLHRLASIWFRDHGHTAEAVQHALASGDGVLCAGLLEHLGGWHYVLQGHVDTVQKVLDMVDSEDIKNFPRLWLARIYLLSRLGNLDRSEREIERLDRHFMKLEDIDTNLTSEARIIKSLVNRYGDKAVTEEEIISLEKLSAVVPPDNHVLHATRCNLLCALYREFGRFDDCMTIGDQAISHYRAMGSLYGEAFLYFHEGYACMQQARIRDAESLYLEGYSMAVETVGPESDLAAIGCAFLAEVSYEKNRIYEARQYLDNALPHIEKADAWLEVFLAAYLTRMRLLQSKGRVEELARTAARAKFIAINRGLVRLGTLADLQMEEFSLRQAESASHTAAPAPALNGNQRFSSDINRYQLEVSVFSRRLIRSGAFEAASTLLEQQSSQARSRGLNRAFISFSILLAASRWLSGDNDVAVAAFEQALSASIFEGIKRPFIDEGELLLGVIRDLTKASGQRRGNRLRDAFIAELLAEINASTNAENESDQVLSPREREVLLCVMQGQSNREIAEAISLSINTVKFHLKNIFDKLAVTSRKDAVSVAIRQQIF